MGGGKDKAAANQQLDEAAIYEKKKRDEFDARNQQDLTDSQAKGKDLYGSLREGYGKLASGDFGTKPAASGGGGGGGGSAPPANTPAAYDWTKDPRFNEVDKNFSDLGKTGGVDLEKLRQNDPTYQSIRDTGGYDAAAMARARGGLDKISAVGDKLTNFGTGGINTTIDSTAQARMRGGGGFEDFAKTGGITQENMDRLRGMGGWDEIAKSGGLTDDDIQKIQGSGTFDEFRKTGGYSEGDIQNIRARASSAIPSSYSRIKDEANRQASVTGMYGPGRSSLLGRLGRDQAEAEGNLRLNTETDIRDKVNTGRQWGATAQSGAQTGLASLRTGNRLQALSGMSGAEQGLVDRQAAGRQFGVAGMAQSEGALQNQISDRERAGAGMTLDSMRAGADVLGQAHVGERGLQDTITANRMGAAGAMDTNERQAQGLRQQGMMFGTGGLAARAEGDRGYTRGVLESDRDYALRQAALAQSAGAAGAAQDRWQQSFDFERQQAGLSGLSSLYGGGGSGEYMANKNFDIANRNQGSSGIGNLAGSRLSGNQGTNWGGLIGSSGGIISGLKGGFGVGAGVTKPGEVPGANPGILPGDDPGGSLGNGAQDPRQTGPYNPTKSFLKNFGNGTQFAYLQ